MALIPGPLIGMYRLTTHWIVQWLKTNITENDCLGRSGITSGSNGDYDDDSGDNNDHEGT